MSKEIDEMESSVDGNNGVSTAVVTSTTNNNIRRRRKRIFSFYAPQMLAGNTPSELSVYPSQTSALLRQHNEWRTLRTTTGLDVPIVEVLDWIYWMSALVHCHLDLNLIILVKSVVGPGHSRLTFLFQPQPNKSIEDVHVSDFLLRRCDKLCW